jgi:hypothetical protein
MLTVCSRQLATPLKLQADAIARGIDVPHVRQKNKFWMERLPRHQRFYFIEPYQNSTICAHNLREFCGIISTLDSTSLVHHLQHRDISRWIRDALADADLARILYVIEGKLEDQPLEQTRKSMRDAIQTRYAVSDDATLE